MEESKSIDNDIKSSLDELHKKTDKILTWKEVHETQHETISRDLTGVRDTLYGNPTAESGLVNRVARLWNCKKNISQWKAFWMYILRGVITASVFGMIVWFLTMYKEVPV